MRHSECSNRWEPTNDGEISGVNTWSVLPRLVILIYLSIIGCGPAAPVEVSAVRVVVGESGTLYFNQAQREVTRGEVVELSLQLPTDFHFFNCSNLPKKQEFHCHGPQLEHVM